LHLVTLFLITSGLVAATPSLASRLRRRHHGPALALIFRNCSPLFRLPRHTETRPHPARTSFNNITAPRIPPQTFQEAAALLSLSAGRAQRSQLGIGSLPGAFCRDRIIVACRTATRSVLPVARTSLVAVCRSSESCSSFVRASPLHDGRPNFARLHVRWTWPGTIHLWAFDLLAVNGRDLRLQPLVKRQASLQALLERFGCPAVRPSETFVDGLAMLSAAEEHDLEGVVSKRRDAPYRSVSAGSGARLRRLPGVRARLALVLSLHLPPPCSRE
jgi:hypothetical protein